MYHGKCLLESTLAGTTTCRRFKGSALLRHAYSPVLPESLYSTSAVANYHVKCAVLFDEFSAYLYFCYVSVPFGACGGLLKFNIGGLCTKPYCTVLYVLYVSCCWKGGGGVTLLPPRSVDTYTEQENKQVQSNFE